MPNDGCFRGRRHAKRGIGLRRPLRLFSFYKVDASTGAGLPNAEFALESPGGLTLTGVSDALGLVQFPIAPCTRYILTETAPPAGYAPLGASFQIFMDACGRLFVDGRLTGRFVLSDGKLPVAGSFAAVKVNILTGLPLEGAEFTLSADGQTVATAVSTGAGDVAFSDVAPGAYRLEETVTPPGFQPSEALAVNVAEDGAATINGLPADGFRLPNVPVFTFAFFKIISGTMTGLPGAAFQLSADGTVVGTAVSDDAGLVDFGVIAPGTYQLTETAPPAEYEPDTGVHTVVIAVDGGITVDGSPLDSFALADSPIQHPYTVNYYTASIATDNLVGSVTGTGALGDFIYADLTLFAPAGYLTPGTRSGAVYVTDIPQDNVVSVVYTRLLLSWYVEYYAGELTAANLLGRVRMPDIGYGTTVVLTQAQLDAYRPDYYQSGVQVGGPVSITVNGQVVRVLYLPLEIRTVTVNHYTESAYGSGSFVLNRVTQAFAYDGDVLVGSSFAEYLGPNYDFLFANPAQLTVTGGSNVISLSYLRVAS